ncbi:MAG: 3-deoxy-D-manno-octulosonic acid transferase [Armatimonadota bacterium]
MASVLYNVLLLIALPGAFFLYMWWIFISRKANESWRENLGGLPKFAKRQSGKKLVWIHCASVGELAASLPVQDELRKMLPDALILVTTITQTGNAVARKSAEHADAVGYFPLDYLLFVNRALTAVKPDVFVMVETEMWPNFLSAAKKRNIPSAMINGKISVRSLSRYWKWLLEWAASNIDFYGMQTEVDADRIRLLGVKHEAVKVLGNTKFDQEGRQLSDGTVRTLRTELGLSDDAQVIVAGSTNPGEDEPVLDAFLQIRAKYPCVKLIIAPRQLDRTEEIEIMCESRDLKAARRSRKDTSYGEYDVMILDTFGELAAVYAVGAVAFVGGSLIPKGGHSIIQPILQGKPVFFGQYTFKTKDIAQMATFAGVGFTVKDANDLADSIISVMSDTRILAEIEVACRKLVSENRGASVRCAEAIVKLMESKSEGGSGS